MDCLNWLTLNDIKISVYQSYLLQVKCSTVVYGWWLPYWMAQNIFHHHKESTTGRHFLRWIPSSLSFQCHPSATSTPEYPTAYSPSPCKCLTDISNLTWTDPVPKLLCQTPCSFHFIFLVVQAKYLGVTLDPSVPSSSSSSPPANPISLNFKVNPESKHSSFLLIVQPRASHAF